MSKKKKKLSTQNIQIPENAIADIQGALIDTAPHNAFEAIVGQYEETLEKQQEQNKVSEGRVHIKKRFIDNMAMLKKADNFIHRKHFGRTTPLFITYLFVYLLCMAFLIVNDPHPLLLTIITLLIGGGALVNFYYIKKFHRVNNAIEYQSYIFANALRSDNEFCLIFNDDGDVVYTDPRLEKLIVSEESKNVSPIDLLLLSFEVSPEKVQAIKELIFRNKDKEKITEDSNQKGDLNTLSLKSVHSKQGVFTVTVHELANPVGYTTLKMIKLDEEKGS